MFVVLTCEERASVLAPGYGTEWFSKVGVPARIDLDHACNFKSLLIRQFRGFHWLKKSPMTLYYPAGNGQCERFNHTYHNLLHTFPTTWKSNWHCCLPQLLCAYTTASHQLTGESPYFLMLAREVRPTVDYLLGRVSYRGSVNDCLQENRAWVHLAVEGDQTFRCMSMV